MFHKIFIITASSLALTFGGAFASGADANQVDTKQLSHKVLYTMNGELENLSEGETSNLLKKAFESLQNGGVLKNIDFSQFAKTVEVEKEKAEEPVQEKEEPKQETPAPVEKKEEQTQKPQEPKQEEKAPVAEEEKQEAQPQPEKVEQPKQEAAQAPQAPEQPKTEPKQEQSQSSALSQFESQVVELTNQERANNGLQPLQADNELSKVAREKSRDMAVNGYFDHNSPSYGSPFDMMKSYGISYSTAGENIAKGQKTPQEVVTAWMNSPGHRENILNGNFTHIGVGFVEQGNHWTQQFIGK